MRFDGIDLLSLSDRARRKIVGKDIAMIFQEPMTSLNPSFSVGYQIMETLAVHEGGSRTERRRRTLELLEQVGIPAAASRLDSFPHQLSGGMCQRVMIAMAIACNPKLLIADEPTTALDVTIQAQILDLLVSLSRDRNMAMVLITHDMGVVAEMCDEVAVMYLGRVVEQGPVDTIFHAPKHPYTRALLRSIPSIQAPVRTRLPTIAGSIPHPYNRPPGCAFHPRCPDFMPDRCDRAEPALERVGEDQRAACFLYGDAVR
jgi:oligopeptide/dipeptide ABC transporter ATP-binding protein